MTTLATAEWEEHVVSLQRKPSSATVAVNDLLRKQEDLFRERDELKKELLARIADGDTECVELLMKLKGG